MIGPFLYSDEREADEVDTALKAATGIMFAAMAGVCLLGGMAVLKKKEKRER